MAVCEEDWVEWAVDCLRDVDELALAQDLPSPCGAAGATCGGSAWATRGRQVGMAKELTDTRPLSHRRAANLERGTTLASARQQIAMGWQWMAMGWQWDGNSTPAGQALGWQ